MTIRGQDGAVRHGYHLAASLRAWTVTKDEHGQYSLTATIVKQDAFRLSQRPISFVALHAKGAWQWPITSLQIVGATLSASLGPKEVDHVVQNSPA